MGLRERQVSVISEVMPYQKRFLEVSGYAMAYVDAGQGNPIVFLHGNPASSYLWRNIAPYLIGMGDSQKLIGSGPGSYTFAEHRRYLDGLLASLGVERNVTLVVHDWGSAIGFDWANRNRAAVHGLHFLKED